MQYYRLWIYACNAVLLSSVVAFVATVLTIVTDYRAELTKALGLFQPCVVYGFLVLALQGCGLTIYGCVAARRLDTRLVKIYWYLILCFLGSDIVTGATWMIKFEGQMSNFTDKIRHHFSQNYGNESEFTQHWDNAQKELRCCGIESPGDFKLSSWWTKTDFEYPHRIVPESCCAEQLESHYLTERATDSSNEIENPITVYYQSSEQSRKSKQRKLGKNQNKSKSRKGNKLRESHNEAKSKSELDGMYVDMEYPVTQAFRRNYKKNRIQRTEAPPLDAAEQKVYQVNYRHECRRTSFTGRDIHQSGCGTKLAAWLQQSAALLFVLNYCVLAFVKVCFLAILRHELKEMIQKIELLKTQDTAPLFPELAAALGLNKLSPQPTRKTIGQMTEVADVRNSKSQQIPNGIVEMEPLLYSNHIQHSSDSVLNKRDDSRKSDKELSADDVAASSPIQNANSVLGNAIGAKDGRPFNNNDYFEMKELSGKSRQTDI